MSTLGNGDATEVASQPGKTENPDRFRKRNGAACAALPQENDIQAMQEVQTTSGTS